MALLPRHDTDPDEPEEKPLEPAAERIQERMRGMLRMSSLIMAGGLLAVFSAILYRVVKDDGPSAATGEIAVPATAGARLLAATPDGERLALLVEDADGTRSAVVVDLSSGAVVSRARLVATPGATP